MRCPHCNHTGKPLVLETRLDREDGVVYRRRCCASCGKGFVTREEAPPGLTMPERVRHWRHKPATPPAKADRFGAITLNWKRADFVPETD